MRTEAPNKLSEVNAFKSDERGGNLNVQPSVGVGNVDLISVSENTRGSSISRAPPCLLEFH